MDASKNPAYLRRLTEDVTTFKAKFVEFMKFHVENTGFGAVARGVAPAVWAKDDSDPELVAEIRSAVSYYSGRAAEAAELTKTLYGIEGIPAPVNPIENWDTILQPKPLLEPSNILSACDRIKGKLQTMIAKAEAEAPKPLGLDAFHPLIWGAAKRLWADGHYRPAVAAAAESLISNVKFLTGRNDVPETSLWQQVFSENLQNPASLACDGPATRRIATSWP